jgi:alkylation response protein AidB-like acyl-CoA dehydrogenase
MELTLTDDQQLLRDTATRFMEAACSLETVRGLVETSVRTDLPEKYMQEAAELGWFSLLVPEEFGGGSISGHGLRDAAILAEERGRRLQPGPFVAMNVVASALAASGTTQQREAVLPEVMSGEAIAAWLVNDANGAWAPGNTLTATGRNDGYVLSGVAGVTQGAADATWLLAVASSPGGLSQFLIPADTAGVTIRPLVSHDITQRFATVELNDVELGPDTLVGTFGGAAPDVEQQFQVALTLLVAETLGALDGLFEMTRQYAIDRIAFGRPIGSYQGVKYQLADMSLSIEASHAISTAATKAVQNGQSDAGEVASMAKAWLGEIGVDVAQGCFQIFAGIGYTWEHDLHLFLRRITMNELLLGQAEWHRERICTIHGL